jgi:hypothetical protein
VSLHLQPALPVTTMNPQAQTSGLTAIARTGSSVPSAKQCFHVVVTIQTGTATAGGTRCRMKTASAETADAH